MTGVGRAIAEEREGTFDELALADRPDAGRDAGCAAETAAREKRRDVFLFRRAQAAAGETVACDQVDVGARDLRKLLRDAIVEREAERDGAQDFGLVRTSRAPT